MTTAEWAFILSLPRYSPPFTFLNLCLPSGSLHSLIINAIYSLQTPFFSVLLPSAQNDFLPLPGPPKRFSSVKCLTHTHSYKAFFEALAQGVPSSQTPRVFMTQALFSGVLCSRKAAKSFLTLSWGPVLTERTSWLCRFLLITYPQAVVTALKGSKWITICRELVACFTLKRLTF